MQHNTTYKIFLEILQQRIPDKKILAKHLSDILHIEKEAIYRRLRGTVPFSFPEITKIALLFDISLDSILFLGNQNVKSFPLRLTTTNLWKPEDIDYFMLEEFIENLKDLDKYPKSETISITNTVPQIFYTNYESLHRFYLFKWQYEEDSSYTKTPYKDIHETEKLKEINRLYQKYIIKAYTNIIVWDKNTLRMLVEDIRYFYDIRLISGEEMLQLWEDLNQFLKDLEKITLKGQFENGRKVQFYVSHISIKGNYSTIVINPNYILSMAKWFTLNDTITTDEAIYRKMVNWMASLQRTSILISESGEIQRIRFFEEQSKIISLLKNL